MQESALNGHANKALGIAALTLHVIDYRQSSQLPKMYEHGYREANPLFGSNPSQSAIDRNFAIATLVGMVLANVLDDKYRTNFLRATVVVKGLGVAHNEYMGVQFKL